MLAANRRKKILSLINQKGSIKVSEIIDKFNISSMTALRDLKALAKQGLVNKVHGGALKIDEGLKQESPFEKKILESSEEKSSIAKYAATHFVNNEEILILSGGSSVLSMLPYLKQENLTLLTNGLETLRLASKFMNSLKCTVMGAGGILREKSLTFVGPVAESFFGRFKADAVFLSATGLTLEEGLMDPDPLEKKVKRTMHRSASKLIALVDSSKFGKRSLTTSFQLEEIDVLITDRAAPTPLIKKIKGIIPEVILT